MNVSWFWIYIYFKAQVIGFKNLGKLAANDQKWQNFRMRQPSNCHWDECDQIALSKYYKPLWSKQETL